MLDFVKKPDAYQSPKFSDIINALLNGERVTYHCGFLAEDRVKNKEVHMLADQVYMYIYPYGRDPRGALLQRRVRTVLPNNTDRVQYIYYAQLFPNNLSPIQ